VLGQLITKLQLVTMTPSLFRFGELPDDFYAITKEELKREQQARQEQSERLGMLRTKAMRERDELRELRRYRCVTSLYMCGVIGQHCVVMMSWCDNVVISRCLSQVSGVGCLFQFQPRQLTTENTQNF